MEMQVPIPHLHPSKLPVASGACAANILLQQKMIHATDDAFKASQPCLFWTEDGDNHMVNYGGREGGGVAEVRSQK